VVHLWYRLAVTLTVFVRPHRWRQHPERVVSFYPRLYSAEGDQPPVTRKEKVAISRCAVESPSESPVLLCILYQCRLQCQSHRLRPCSKQTIHEPQAQAVHGKQPDNMLNFPPLDWSLSTAHLPTRTGI